MIRLEDVRVFLEIARSGSFTEAGRTLGAPKSTVARQLSRLEDQLGCLLISRTSRTVALTDRGATFAPYARQLLDDGVEAQNIVRDQGFGAHGLVRVSSATTFGGRFLAPLLPAFRQRHPRVRIELSLSPLKVAVSGSGAAADVAIRLGALVEPDLGVRRLGEIDFWMVASPEYLTSRPDIHEPGDLARHEFIALFPRHASGRLSLHRGRTSHLAACVPIITIDDPEAIKAAVLAAGGVASLPSFLVADEIRQGRLTHVLPDWAGDPTPVTAVYETRRQPPLRVTAFVDFLAATLGETQPWRVEGERRAP